MHIRQLIAEVLRKYDLEFHIEDPVISGSAPPLSEAAL